MLLPYFSEQDDSLVRQGVVRDYLGLQTVWSSVARQLEPNLSGQVTNIQGIKAIGLIYQIMNNYFDADLEKNRRLFFCYMEGLFEYFLVHELGQSACYGARSLSGDKENIEINLNGGTVVIGLYQYYRGTCRRAGILDDEWHLDSNLATIYQNLIPSEKAVQKLLASFKTLMKEKRNRFSPSRVMQDEAIRSIFSTVFSPSDSQISRYLESIFYKDKNIKIYASSCSIVVHGENEEIEGSRAYQIYQKLLSQSADYPRIDAMQNFLDCEPFLCLLDDMFHSLLNAESLGKFETLSILKESTVIEKAQAFIKLDQVSHSEFSSARFKELYQLAHMIIAKQWRDFASMLFQYHEQIMLARKLGPVAMIEGEKVVSIQDIGRYDDELLSERINNQHVWNNGYYIHATASIYSQIQEELKGAA